MLIKSVGADANVLLGDMKQRDPENDHALALARSLGLPILVKR